MHDAPFLEVFRAPLPLRSRGTFHLVACKHIADDRPVTVLFAPKPHDRRLAREALSAVAQAHRAIRSELVPPVYCEGESKDGTAYVAFDFPATVDGTEFARLLGDSRIRLPYPVADTLGTTVREAVQAGHATVKPKSNDVFCLGGMTNGNLLFAPDGRLAMIGFGHNVAMRDERGFVEAVEAVFSAPEVATGASPTPMSDYVSVLMWVRSYLLYVDILPMVARVIAGTFSPGDDELLTHMRYFETEVINTPAALRPPMPLAIQRSERIRELLDVTLDRPGLVETIRGLLERHGELDDLPSASSHARAVGSDMMRVATDGSWIETEPGVRQALGRTQRRITLALCRAHQASPGVGLDVWSLVDAGWPGEKPVYEAAMNRVYVTMSRLRKAGLERAIERFDDGYRLRPSIRIVTVDA